MRAPRKSEEPRPAIRRGRRGARSAPDPRSRRSRRSATSASRSRTCPGESLHPICPQGSGSRLRPPPHPSHWSHRALDEAAEAELVVTARGAGTRERSRRQRERRRRQHAAPPGAIQRERDGAAVDLDQQWRLDDSEERPRLVAELAYRMQHEGYKRSRRAPMVRAWDDAVGLLGGERTRDRREQFLRWLVASAAPDRSAHRHGPTRPPELSGAPHRVSRVHHARGRRTRCDGAVPHGRQGLVGNAPPVGRAGRRPRARQARPGARRASSRPGRLLARGADLRGRDRTIIRLRRLVEELPVRLSDPFIWWEDCAGRRSHVTRSCHSLARAMTPPPRSGDHRSRRADPCRLRASVPCR